MAWYRDNIPRERNNVAHWPGAPVPFIDRCSAFIDLARENARATQRRHRMVEPTNTSEQVDEREGHWPVIVAARPDSQSHVIATPCRLGVSTTSERLRFQGMDEPKLTAPAWLAPISLMLARAEYGLPIAAAQSQFRERFYGLNAAALLEDLFVDALENFARKHRPDISIERAPRGEKAFDYTIGSVEISHKVGLGAQPIAVLWDATKRLDTWSGEHPIAYHLTERQPRVREGRVLQGGARMGAGVVKIWPLYDRIPTERSSTASRLIAVVHWPPIADVATVLRLHPVSGSAATLADATPFSDLWSTIAEAIESDRIPANEIDVLLVRAESEKAMPNLEKGDGLLISNSLRSGIYGLAPAQLTNVPLTSNNRAQLIPQQTVATLLDDARNARSFVPMPTWIAPYLAQRPPSLYLTQEATFSSLF